MRLLIPKPLSQQDLQKGLRTTDSGLWLDWLEWLYGRIMLNKAVAASGSLFLFLCICRGFIRVLSASHNGSWRRFYSLAALRDLCDYFNAAALRQNSETKGRKKRKQEEPGPVKSQ